MAKFCPECAHPIIDENLPFCPKCGTKLTTTSPEVHSSTAQPVTIAPPTQSSSYPPKSSDSSSIQTSVDEQNRENTPKTRSILEWVAICCGGIILLIIVSAFFAGMSQNISSTSSSSASNDKILSQDLSPIALTINDLPTGWKTYGNVINTSNIYSSKFIEVQGLSANFVNLNITRYVTIEEAKNKYTTQKAKITQFKVESVNLGNEGFGYVNDDSSIVLFRKGNIIVQTQYGVGSVGGSLFPLSISDAQDYAKIVAGRIK